MITALITKIVWVCGGYKNAKQEKISAGRLNFSSESIQLVDAKLFVIMA